MGLIRNWQRRRLLRQPFPKAWEKILERRFTFYHRLPANDLEVLRDLIRIFVAEKAFEGCNGQAITDDVRIVIAAYAGLLLLGRAQEGYAMLGTILVYPTSFAAPLAQVDDHGIVTELMEERLGESWDLGSVVLAWDSLLELCAGRAAGLNVVLHEFAHQIDSEEGISDGAPLQPPVGSCRDWTDLRRAAYARERSARRRGRPLVLDPYGAQSTAEFFAVATETFFERPVRLKAHHPALYAALQALYGQDPVTAWYHF